MKKLIVCAIALLCAFGTVEAQVSKDLIKERKELRKATKAELNEKSSKAAQKEAKQLKKDGWITAPGALPLEKQLDRSYMMQMEYDDDMYPKYIMGEGMSIGENYDAAKMQAQELAKQNLASQIQTEITSLIENSVGNEQLEADEAKSITQTILGAKNLISQSIGRTITVVECYRVKKNKNKEVLVRVAYNGNMAKSAAKQALRDELKNRSEEIQKKLSEVIGW